MIDAEAQFGMNPYQVEDEVIDNSGIENDLEYAKKNLRDLIDNTIKLVPFAIRISKESESPRSVEVVSGLVKAVSDLNKDLISLTPQKKESEETKTITNQQNNLFLGSTEDIFAKLKQLDIKELGILHDNV